MPMPLPFKTFLAGAIALCTAPPALAGSLYHIDRAGQQLQLESDAEGMRIVRRTPRGDLDTRFGGTHGVLLALGQNQVPPTAIAVDPNERILVAATVRTASGKLQSAVLRLDRNGSPDPTWGQDGVALDTPSAEPLRLIDILPLLDGSVFVLADVGWDERRSRPALWRLSAAGQLDRALTPNWLQWSLPQGTRGLALARAGVAAAMVAVEVKRDGTVEQEMHRLDTAAPENRPEVVARQSLPKGDIVSPVLRHEDSRWLWVEGEMNNDERFAVRFLPMASAPSSPWTLLPSAEPSSEPIALEPEEKSPRAEDGGAIYSPFVARDPTMQEPPQAGTPRIGADWIMTVVTLLLTLAAGVSGWRWWLRR